MYIEILKLINLKFTFMLTILFYVKKKMKTSCIKKANLIFKIFYYVKNNVYNLPIGTKIIILIIYVRKPKPQYIVFKFIVC